MATTAGKNIVIIIIHGFILADETTQVLEYTYAYVK